MSNRVSCIVLTLVIECICVICRFGYGWTSTDTTASTVGRMTFGLRIHHGYIGVLLVAVAATYGWLRGSAESSANDLTRSDHTQAEELGIRPDDWMRWSLVIGFALIVSDLIHHFLVLWPLTGSPQFDLVYPAD